MANIIYDEPDAGEPRVHGPGRGGDAAAALRDPRNRALLIVAGVALLLLLVALAFWYNHGANGTKHDLASANAKVAQKEREVEDTRRLLEQKIAELQVARAEANVQAAKLGTDLSRDVTPATGQAGGEVYVPAPPVRRRR